MPDRVIAVLKRQLDLLLGVPLTWILSLLWNRRSSRGGVVRGRSPRRVLVIKLAAVGDAVLLVPALRSLRKALPEARIDWLVSTVNQTVARTVPYVDDVIVWPRTSLRTLPNVIRRLRAESYDLVIDADQWARVTSIVSFLTGAPERIGFDTPGQHRARLYTRAHRKTFADHEMSEFLKLFSLVAPLEVDPSLELWDTARGQKELEERLGSWLSGRSNAPLVLIHPGCGADGLPREWPLASFAAIGRWLKEVYGAELILSSGPEETHKPRELNDLLGGEAHDVGGKLSWLGMISLMRYVDLVISGNTGVMHIAAAMGRRQIALHGPTDPALWGPVNPNAVVVRSSCPECPCLRLGFEYHRFDSSCMSRIDTGEVKDAVVRLLGRRMKQCLAAV